MGRHSNNKKNKRHTKPKKPSLPLEPELSPEESAAMIEVLKAKMREAKAEAEKAQEEFEEVKKRMNEIPTASTMPELTEEEENEQVSVLYRLKEKMRRMDEEQRRRREKVRRTFTILRVYIRNSLMNFFS